MRARSVVAAAFSLRARRAAVSARRRRPSGVQDPAWSPDGKRIAVSYLDRIWTMTPDGRQAKAVDADRRRDDRARAGVVAGRHPHRLCRRSRRRLRHLSSCAEERRAAAPVAVTTMPGDERWPSWTPDGRLVFAHRDDEPRAVRPIPSLQWDLFVVAPVPGSEAWQAPLPLTETDRQRNLSARVARRPHGRVRLRSRFRRRSSICGGCRCRRRASPSRCRSAPGRRKPVTVVRAGGYASAESRPPRADAHHARARRRSRTRRGRPTTTRVAFYAVREGIGSVWVAHRRTAAPAKPTKIRMPRPKPAAQPQLVSRRGGAPAWSPDGKTLLVAGPARSAAGLQRQPAAQRSRSAAALRVERARSSCGACRRRCRCTKTAALSPTELAPSPALLRRGVRSRVADAARRCITRRARSAERGLRAARQVSGRARSRRRTKPSSRPSIDEMVAEQPLDQAGGHLERRGRRLGPSARVGSRPPRASKRAATSSTR